MFSLKFFILFICVQNIICVSGYGIKNIVSTEKFFRKDYIYLGEAEAFYKFHSLGRNWNGAKEQCESEGSELFYPVDENEARVVSSYWNETHTFKSAYIGISAPNSKQVFETIDGLPINSVYNTWAPGEPNNKWGVEDCVQMNYDGTLNDIGCTAAYPFICKKALKDVRFNHKCGIYDQAYKHSEKLNKCYKFHSKPATWTDAYVKCFAEQSYLAVIDSQEEADFLVELTAEATKEDVEGDFVRGAVHLGFKKINNIWVTPFKNKQVSHSEYAEWGAGQPDNNGKENCGSMFYNGKLNDIDCNEKLFFICEQR